MKIFFLKTLFAFIITLSISASVAAQDFYKLIGDSATETPRGIIKCKDGGYLYYGSDYVSGDNTWHGSICKLDSSGNVLWQKYMWRTIWVEETSTGGFYIGTFGYPGTNPPQAISKLDNSGNLIWVKEYFFTGASDRHPTSLTRCANDDLFICQSVTNGGLFKPSILKIDSSGNVLWNKNITTGSFLTEYFIKIRVAPDNAVYILASFGSPFGSLSYYLAKMDLDGNFIWTKYLYSDHYTDFEAVSDTEIIVSMAQLVYTINLYGVRITKLDSAGNIKSTLVYYSDGNNVLKPGIVAISPSEYQVYGSVAPDTNGQKYFPFLLNVNDSNEILRSVIYNDSGFSYPQVFMNQSGDPDLLVRARMVDGINYAAVIHDSGTPGICIAAPILFDTITQSPSSSNSPALTVSSFTVTSGMGVYTDVSGNFSRDGCSVFNSAGNIDESEKPKVYPVPFSDNLNFSMTDTKEYIITICDLFGRVIMTNKFYGRASINTEKLSAGIYLYELNGFKGKFTGKVVKTGID